MATLDKFNPQDALMSSFNQPPAGNAVSTPSTIFDFTSQQFVTPQPTVQPGSNPFDPAKGSMTTPTKPTAPKTTPKPASGAGTSSTPAAPAAPTEPAAGQPVAGPGNFDQSQFAFAMDKMRSKIMEKNALADRRGLLVKALFDSPLNEEELKKLSPEEAKAITTGDQDLLEWQIRLLNQNLQGKTKSLDSAVSYLTDAYTRDVETAEKQRDRNLQIVQEALQLQGSRAFSNLPAEKKRQLEQQAGLPDGYLDNIPTTMAEQQEARLRAGSGGGSSGGVIGSIKLADGTTVAAEDIDFANQEQVNALPISDLAKSVIMGYGSMKELTPTMKSEVQTELYQVGFKPKQYVINKLDALAQQYENLPGHAKGVVEGRVLPFASSMSARVAEFESNKQVLTREIARLNDVGVLSDQDVASYKDAMPSRSDANINVVRGKIKGLKSAITGDSGDSEKSGNAPQSGTLSSGLKYTIEP
jgi:hypothetical protein